MENIIEYFTEKLNDFDYKRLIIPTILLLIFVGGFSYLYNQIDRTKKESKKDLLAIEEVTKESSDIYVDIKGYVNKPGVYKISSSSRVIDAIEVAGGLKKDANTRFINLSKSLNDPIILLPSISIPTWLLLPKNPLMSKPK